MSYDFILEFHKLAFFRMAPVPKLLGIVADARRCLDVFDAAALIQRRLAELMPADVAIGVLRELERLLADPPPAEKWSETLAYLDYAVRDVIGGTPK